MTWLCQSVCILNLLSIKDTDLQIEGFVANTESVDPGVVECMEVDEEENVNGDVILRCLCNESEEG